MVSNIQSKFRITAIMLNMSNFVLLDNFNYIDKLDFLIS